MNFRFGGIARLYGAQGLERLFASHVAVIGLGGVGSWTVEALARSGVGQLTLVDFDDICVSNTNRQVHAISPHVGHMKTGVLKERVSMIHPQCQVHCLEDPYSEKLNPRLFSHKPDIIIDTMDQFLAKRDLALACRERDVPLIVAGAAGGRHDPSAIRSGDLSKSCEDPMLAHLRKRLRQKHGFPRKGKMGVDCVFSIEKPRYPNPRGEITSVKPEQFKKPLDCASGFGTVTWVTGSFGFQCAHLSVQRLLQNEHSLQASKA